MKLNGLYSKGRICHSRMVRGANGVVLVTTRRGAVGKPR